MPKSESVRPWTKHLGLPQVPVIITNPDALVQIKEDGVRGRCRVAKACDVDWERVTKWRWDNPISAEPAHARNPSDMSHKECVEERHVIAAERARMERALMAAKRSQDTVAVRDWGHRIQALTQRASALKARLHEALEDANKAAFKQAAKDVLPPDLLRKLYDRANAIEEAMLK